MRGHITRAILHPEASSNSLERFQTRTVLLLFQPISGFAPVLREGPWPSLMSSGSQPQHRSGRVKEVPIELSVLWYGRVDATSASFGPESDFRQSEMARPALCRGRRRARGIRDWAAGDLP